MDSLLRGLPKFVSTQIKGNISRAEVENMTVEKVQSPNCRRLITHLQETVKFLDDRLTECPFLEKILVSEKSYQERLIKLAFGIDKTLSYNTRLLVKGNNKKTLQRKMQCDSACDLLLETMEMIHKETNYQYQKAHLHAQAASGIQLFELKGVLDKPLPPDFLSNKLKDFQSHLNSADAETITGYCLQIFPIMSLFSDLATETLKKLTRQEIKEFGIWANLLDQTFDRFEQFYPDQHHDNFSQCLEWILLIFDQTLFEFGNLSVLIKFLQTLGKPHFQQYHPDLTDILISLFTRQLKGLNGIIKEKASTNQRFKLEQSFKSKLVDAINKLLPDWQSLNNEAYLQLLSNLIIKEDESYWFDLIYTLTHHDTSKSHHLSSDHWQQALLAKLDEHDPDARRMLAAIGNQNPSTALQVATDNHRLLWLKAFLYNQAGDHQSAYNAITKAEERCNELGLTPERRLRLEIVRIKLASLKATATCDEPQPDDLRSIIKQLDKLSALLEGCNKLGTSALEQLTPWTKEEITRAEQLRNEAHALKKASGRVSPPQVQPVQETEEQPVQEMASPAVPPLPSQAPEAICQKILRHLQPRQRCTEPEAMEPDDTFMVMTGNGKSIPVNDAMKEKYWSSKISHLLNKVNYHRNDGDFVNELLTYQEVLTDKTNKERIGTHRLILELSWTLMRHADRALGENKMTPTEAGILLDYAWEFMMQSVYRAMHRGSPFPAQLSDKELIATVIEWIQALKDPKTKADMEFFMRCTLGSTAGHINGFRAELFPGQKDRLEERAIFFFNAKHHLQPGYVKPTGSIDSKVRSVCLHQSQSARWSR